MTSFETLTQTFFDIGTAEDLFHKEGPPLSKIFKPQSVAIVGATENIGSVGRTLMWNLISSPFGGTVFPVNPRRISVMGIKCYASVTAIGEPIDLVVVCVPAPHVSKVIEECGKIGVPGAIVISAGFSEAGEQGRMWAQQIKEFGKKYKMRIVGPNCLGVMNCISGLNATFANKIALPGKVACISQSGALATAMLDFAFKNNVGFSAAVSIGSMLDVSLGDLIEYFGHDPDTESIVIYMESIGDASSFVAAAQSVSLTKPIIVIKAGRTPAGGLAAASHTGTLTGDDEVLDAVFKKCGLLQVETIEELFHCTEVLAKQPIPKGNRLSIVTNAGGPGTLSVDALSRGGGVLSQISPEIMKELNTFLPEYWSHGNPLDILGDADAKRYAKTLETVSKDPNNDAVLVILTPQAMTDPTATANVLVERYNAAKKEAIMKGEELKPLFASWMGGKIVEKGNSILSQAGIPTFEYPDVAVNVFNRMWQYHNTIKEIHTVPQSSKDTVSNFEILHVHSGNEKKNKAIEVFKAISPKGRTLLSEFESKQLLEIYDLPIVKTLVATNLEESVKFAEQIGFPVVLKVHSETITHKMDVGGVKLNLKNKEEVKEAFLSIQKSVGEVDFLGVTVQKFIKFQDAHELILGCKMDTQIGPVILFGQGGSYVEIYKDTIIGIPPITKLYARKMIQSTKISKILHGYRGKKAVDLEKIETLLVQFSILCTDLGEYVKELDINPLLVSSENGDMCILDARVLLHEQNDEIALPAIRQYPRQYVKVDIPALNSEQAADFKSLTIRPSNFEDYPWLVKFFEKITDKIDENPLSDQSFNYGEAFLKLLQQQQRMFFKGKEFSSTPTAIPSGSPQKKEDIASIREENIKKLKMLKHSQKVDDLLLRMCSNLFENLVLFAVPKGQREILGLACFTKWKTDKDVAEMFITVDADHRSRGLGRFLVERLKICAKAEGIKKLMCKIPKANKPFMKFCSMNGFNVQEVNGACIASFEL